MRRVCFFIFTALGLVAATALRADAINLAPVRVSLLESNVVFVRVSWVAAGLAEELAAANPAMSASNKFSGTILDLRFADGAADAAVAPVVQWFAAQKRPLAILVNGQTRGAAAALAAALRSARLGLVFGSETADLKPDIAVAVGAAAEKIYYADAYAGLTNTVTGAATNLVSKETNRPLPRISEADLVRARRAGAADPEAELDASGGHETPSERQMVRDPVLARALDLLKGLATVRARRPE